MTIAAAVACGSVLDDDFASKAEPVASYLGLSTLPGGLGEKRRHHLGNLFALAFRAFVLRTGVIRHVFDYFEFLSAFLATVLISWHKRIPCILW
nr:hypothetical protein [Halomonas heilongjiangensis]